MVRRIAFLLSYHSLGRDVLLFPYHSIKVRRGGAADEDVKRGVPDGAPLFAASVGWPPEGVCVETKSVDFVKLDFL